MSSSIQGKAIYIYISLYILLSSRSLFNPNDRLGSKIDLLDPPEVISKKIRKAEAAPRVIEDNGVLALVEYVLLPAASLRGNREFRVERRDDTPLVYTDIKQVNEDYQKDIVRDQTPYAGLVSHFLFHC